MSALKRLQIDDGMIANLKQKAVAKQTIQTHAAFDFKWKQAGSYGSKAFQTHLTTWLRRRYLGDDPARLRQWFDGDAKLILDAGCGAGLPALALFGDYLRRHDYLGVDLSGVVASARANFAAHHMPGDFLQADFLALPIAAQSIDIVFAEGVLHHTDDTGRAICCLARKLKTGGRFLFYVYAQKAVIREMTDDHIRRYLAAMSDEEAWQALKPLSRLGQRLGRMDVEIDVPEDIPFLGIAKGRMSLQRFFYWYVCKMFHHEEFDFDEMHHINFDWFRPQNCHRHTPEQIEHYCEAAALAIEHMDVQRSGITVVARKEAARP